MPSRTTVADGAQPDPPGHVQERRRPAGRSAGSRRGRRRPRPQSVQAARTRAAAQPPPAAAPTSSSRRPLFVSVVMPRPEEASARPTGVLEPPNELTYARGRVDRTARTSRARRSRGGPVRLPKRQHPVARGVLVDRVNEYLTRREALVAALAATALGGGALRAPRGCACRGDRHGAHRRDPAALATRRDGRGQQRAQGGAAVGRLGQRPRRRRRAARRAQDLRRQGRRRARRQGRRARDREGPVLGHPRAAGTRPSRWPRSRRPTGSATPFFVSYAWSPDVTKASYPEVVRIGPNNDMLTSAFAPFMTKRDYKRVAVIAEDTAFGQGLGETIRANATLAGIDVFARGVRARHARPAARPQAAARAQAGRARDRRGGRCPARTLAVTQARGAGFKGDIVLGWDYVDEAFWKATGKHGVGRHLADVLGPDPAPHGRGPGVQARCTRSATSTRR